MNEQQAFNVLVQALSAANKAGVFELKDSATIFAALGVLAPRFEEEAKKGMEKPAMKGIEDAPKPKAKK
ncbi:MAG: hypothetical protein ACSLE0_23325 [Chitinophagaceae bacterium]